MVLLHLALDTHLDAFFNLTAFEFTVEHADENFIAAHRIGSTQKVKTFSCGQRNERRSHITGAHRIRFLRYGTEVFGRELLDVLRIVEKLTIEGALIGRKIFRHFFCRQFFRGGFVEPRCIGPARHAAALRSVYKRLH